MAYKQTLIEPKDTLKKTLPSDNNTFRSFIPLYFSRCYRTLVPIAERH